MPDKYRIEFGELKIGELARQHLKDVCDSNWASSGPKVKQFEQEWGKLFGYKYNAAVSSGTDACLNACLSLYNPPWNMKPGMEIIVPALSFIATSNAVRAAGFKPKWVDVDYDLNINPELIEPAIGPNTAGIMVVHTMGKPCKMDTVQEIISGLPIIEDCCETHGASYNGTYVGHWGHAACFSYYIAHLICCGEGGMVSTNYKETYDSLVATRTHGRPHGNLYFDHPMFGLNSKMNDLEASIGLEGISQFWNTFFRRKNNLYFLMNKLARYRESVWMNTEEENEVVCPHGFSMTFKPDTSESTVSSIQKELEDKGIKCKRNFGSIPTQHGAFKSYGHKLGEFPIAEYIGNHGFHFGVHQYLSQEDLWYIVEIVSETLDKYL